MSHSSSSSTGAVLGFCLAPLFTGLGVGFIGVMLSAIEQAISLGGFIFEWRLCLFVVCCASVVAYLGLGVFGLPLHLLLAHLKKTSAIYYCGVAAVIPVGVFIVPLLGEVQRGAWQSPLFILMVMSSCAVVCAGVFWFFAVKRVQNRDSD